MLAHEKRQEVALRVLRDCFGLKSLDDQTRFDRSDLEKMNTLHKLSPEIPCLRNAFGLTAMPMLKRPMLHERDAIKLLRQLVRHASANTRCLRYRTVGVRIPLTGRTTSRSVYWIAESESTGSKAFDDHE